MSAPDKMVTTITGFGRDWAEQRIRAQLLAVLGEAAFFGLVVAIHPEPQQPLAMRNYKPVIEITEARK
jgi:hypothetical protein